MFRGGACADLQHGGGVARASPAGRPSSRGSRSGRRIFHSKTPGRAARLEAALVPLPHAHRLDPRAGFRAFRPSASAAMSRAALLQMLRRDDAVDQAETVGLVGGEFLPAEQQELRACRSHERAQGAPGPTAAAGNRAWPPGRRTARRAPRCGCRRPAPSRRAPPASVPFNAAMVRHSSAARLPDTSSHTGAVARPACALLQIRAGGKHLFARPGQDQRHAGRAPRLPLPRYRPVAGACRPVSELALSRPVQRDRPERPLPVEPNHSASPSFARMSGDLSDISSPRCASALLRAHP